MFQSPEMSFKLNHFLFYPTFSSASCFPFPVLFVTWATNNENRLSLRTFFCLLIQFTKLHKKYIYFDPWLWKIAETMEGVERTKGRKCFTESDMETEKISIEIMETKLKINKLCCKLPGFRMLRVRDCRISTRGNEEKNTQNNNLNVNHHW